MSYQQMISAWRDRALALFFLIPGATARKAPNRDGRHGHLVTERSLYRFPLPMEARSR
jgi:hypothetical protein